MKKKVYNIPTVEMATLSPYTFVMDSVSQTVNHTPTPPGTEIE